MDICNFFHDKFVHVFSFYVIKFVYLKIVTSLLFVENYNLPPIYGLTLIHFSP